MKTFGLEKRFIRCARKAGYALITAITAVVFLAASCTAEPKNDNPEPETTAIKDSDADKAPAAPARPKLIKPASVTLLYTTAVSGELVDCGCPGHPRGGLAKRAHYVMGINEAREFTLQVDGGNCFFPSMGARAADDSHKKKAKVLAAGMARMGVQVVNIGRQDLAAGLEFLEEELGRPEDSDPLPLISSNLSRTDSGELVFPPYKVIETGEARIGVFGITSGQLPGGTELAALDPQKAAGEMIEELKAECDLVIGLFAMDFAAASRMAKEVPGADIIIVSDRRSTPRPRPMVIGDSILAQAGNRGMYVGRMDLVIGGEEKPKMMEQERAEINAELKRLEAQRKILAGAMQNDPELRKEYSAVSQKEKELRGKLAESGSRLKYQNSMASIEPEMPEDAEIAGWVEATGVKSKSRAGGH
jgi:2',3'-cyclic-nucleotide 2'-phosphodiesterase (5'-nucleotidase family)